MSERTVRIQAGNWLRIMGGRIKRHRSNTKTRMKRTIKGERRAAARELQERIADVS